MTTIESIQHDIAEVDAQIAIHAARRLSLEREIAWLRGYIAGRTGADLEQLEQENEKS